MKNIQVIDGAVNSTFDVYEVDDNLFDTLFPNDQDIAFLSDFPDIDNNPTFWSQLYSNKVNKKSIVGIHGTLHLTGSYVEEENFPNRKESDARRR
ncbi:hypothetical protein [Effusibacillus lacus]|uniref:Uncharacterized protein n=1 Tax=Effusibacillus lacus TaxID=1348429 RepID=A0A292YRY0_9BACL|nr:hypothetical protein [Effusibacillus lacus]TCS73570.1 hypothetical protein EDD64_11877 [Effusibacillus lacus]GAX91936.1 hypothetical protein EFBL_3627 [Effusibacillus lacus]